MDQATAKDATIPAAATAAVKEDVPLTDRERLYASSARRRDTVKPTARDLRPHSRLYAR
jgi:hypothetical protein